MSTFSLDGYLARIGWSGSREPTLDTIAGILRAHMTRIPFENLDVLLGRGVAIDRDSVYTKLVELRRGGYCFEHGTLCHAAMEQLGFNPVAHTARVILLRPRHEAPQTHMFITATFDDRTFVFDPGFGGHAPLVPVPLADNVGGRDGRDSHRMVRLGNEWVLEAHIDGAAVPLWTSTLAAAEPVDFVMANHFVSTFSQSPFVTNLMLRAITPHGRVSVMNETVTRRHDGREERWPLGSRIELRALLNDYFGFDLPEAERLRVPSVPSWI